MATVGVQLKGQPEVESLLKRLAQPDQDKLTQKALGKGALEAKRHVKEAEGRYSRSGKLARAVSVGRARTKPGSIVRLDKKKSGAFYAHMVVLGTRAHRIRFPDQKARGVVKDRGNIQHPGARPRPFVEEGFLAGQEEIVAAITKVIDDAIESR